MKRRKQSDEEIAKHLERLPQWRLKDDAIVREFTFADFGAAFAFLTRVAMLSERLDHHAELWNVYSKVRIKLWTHEVLGLSEMDFTMATAIEQLL